MTSQTTANADTEYYVARLRAEKAALRRHDCTTVSSGAHARYAVAGPLI
jgi:hypothetical protein